MSERQNIDNLRDEFGNFLGRLDPYYGAAF
jgi:hypothetical protein